MRVDEKIEIQKAVSRPTQQITTRTDSREILANAHRDIEQFHLDDYFIVDVDAHHMEPGSWAEILEHVDDPVIRYHAQAMAESRPLNKNLALSNMVPGMTFQDVFGRIPHQAALLEEVEANGDHRDITLVRRAMDSMGIDVQVVFPTPMLTIGTHPSPEIATSLTFAYNRWFVSRILAKEDRIKALLLLPFDDPAACVRTVREFADKKGVIGFMVTSQRRACVYDNAYMPLYRELEDSGMPLAFHAGLTWGDSMPSSMNRFLAVHAITFVTCTLTHITNWIVNGLPERFPKLKVIWVESGLAWIPFLMQRLDNEYLMRQSDAPLLKKLPSDYMRDMYYTSQPMERTNLELLEATLKVMNAETQLMYSSDWPHWDFDVPGRIAGIPFLGERAKRNILGETARKLFRLENQPLSGPKRSRLSQNSSR